MIVITPHEQGTVISVRAQPKARRPGVGGEQNGALKVAVIEPPDKGKATEAVLAAVADHLGLRRAQVRLIAGETSRDKRLLLVGVTADQLRAKLSLI